MSNVYLDFFGINGFANPTTIASFAVAGIVLACVDQICAIHRRS